MTAVKDTLDIVHAIRFQPMTFTTIGGGMPGQTGCGKQFYNTRLGARSCSSPGAVPLEETPEEVTCMACIAQTANS